jgi:uncharacterized membrane protein YhaH (DUF805 family)
MNEIGPILDAIAFALAALLALIAVGAARRYHDRRFAMVGAALAVLGLVSVAGAVDLLWPGSIPGADLGTVPAVLLIFAEALLYLSFVAARSRAPPPPSP